MGHPHAAGGKQDTTFFKPGNKAIQKQAIFLAIQALAIAVCLVNIGKLIDGDGNVILAVGALLVAVGCEVANVRTQDPSAENARIRKGLLTQAFKLGPARIAKDETGSLVSTMTDSVERVTNYRQGYIGQLIGSVLTPFVTLVVIALVDWLTALALVICLPLVPLVIGLFQKLFRKESRESRIMRGRLAAQFLESVQGLSTLMGIGAGERVGKKLEQTGEDNRQALMKLLARNQLLLFVMEAAFSLFLVCVAITMAYLRAGTVGEAAAIVLLSTQLTTPINQVGGFFYIGMGGRASQSAILGFLARKTGRPRHDGAVGKHDGSVALKDVTFSYDGTPVLEGTNLTARRGEPEVLTGRSGSGKSTMLNILSGDLVPTSGTAVVDGITLDSTNQQEVRDRVAVVRQSTWLFTGSLADNLRVAGDVTEDQMWDALERVDLARWARALPAGLDTQVGERGQSVSGGQAQRISIARALLSGRDIMILDEPTSQVDLESEAIIEQVIKELAAEKTVVLATHRDIMGGK